jgi:hypothetical protein
MAKCTELICDICGEHITEYEGKYDYKSYSLLKTKAKRFWCGWGGEWGWTKQTLHICPQCQYTIKKLVKSSRGK